MADPLPRWRNPKLTTVLELVSILPNSIMKKEDAREIINTQWNALNNTSGSVFSGLLIKPLKRWVFIMKIKKIITLDFQTILHPKS